MNPNAHLEPLNYEESAIKDFVEDNLLDFGCGIGRTFKLYSGNVTGVDFSSLYESRAKVAAKHLDYTHLIHNIHKSKLPFKDKQFKKGVAIKVLLHANNKEANRIIQELGRVCEEVLIIALNTDKEVHSHCFSRDYKEFIGELGEVTSYNKFKDQDIITYRCL